MTHAGGRENTGHVYLTQHGYVARIWVLVNGVRTRTRTDLGTYDKGTALENLKRMKENPNAILLGLRDPTWLRRIEKPSTAVRKYAIARVEYLNAKRHAKALRASLDPEDEVLVRRALHAQNTEDKAAEAGMSIHEYAKSPKNCTKNSDNAWHAKCKAESLCDRPQESEIDDALESC
jgi:hypothetical protein